MQTKNHRLLQSALELLDLVADTGEPVPFKKLEEHVSLPKSTVYNLVQTLCNCQYLKKATGTGGYSIGIRCFQTGNAYRNTTTLLAQAGEIVEALSNACNETTHFAVLQGTEVIYIYKYDGTHSIRVHSEVGKKMPAHATAIGKALLSGYSDEEIRALYPGGSLPALTAHSITSMAVLIEQLRDVRRTSVAYEFEESSPYVKCVAVPIYGHSPHPAAAVSLAMPIYREDTDLQRLTRRLLETKEKLELLYSLYK